MKIGRKMPVSKVKDASQQPRVGVSETMFI